MFRSPGWGGLPNLRAARPDHAIKPVPLTTAGKIPYTAP
jgi:hypothetical protein